MKTKIVACICLLMASVNGFAQENSKKYRFENTELSFDERVNDLVSQLTLEEKVSQMLNASPAIPRFLLMTGGMKRCTE
jgi:beta-glucosidase